MTTARSCIGLVLTVCALADGAKSKGFPKEKCCDECPKCSHNFDVEAPKDPSCRKVYHHKYSVEKVTENYKESFERLDAGVEVLPNPGCKKFYRHHFDVEEPSDCEEEEYEKLDFEVMEVKRDKKCRTVKLSAHADHPSRECQCGCSQRRRYVHNEDLTNITRPSASPQEGGSDRNRIQRLKRSILSQLPAKSDGTSQEPNTVRLFLSPQPTPEKHPFRGRNPYLNRLVNGPRSKRKHRDPPMTAPHAEGFICHCFPSNQQPNGTADELVGATVKPKVARPRPQVEEPVYIGDSARPITYEQIKKHMDALPVSTFSPTTNEIIGNLTILFYDIYQQKHKKNFTLPLKYGTRTVVPKGDGLQQYDIQPIEGVYQPPKLNRIASKGLHIMGRKVDRKTGQGPRANRVRDRT
ncbi:uncharacterized protein LOC131207331 [Anopheles bellator]|uniref:uncharacterized protein LOC131207331 n=1 Tax=Anopheles bellator TaxID=139047 RepID=UPI0026491B87|nr:uncharacterized protein LOC131207331 [Anopheles bellator]